MKKAYVLSDHLGDDGFVREGMILSHISNERFDKLEKKGLVREANADDISGKTARDRKAAAKPANKMAPDAMNKRASELEAIGKALNERAAELDKGDEEAAERVKALDEREASLNGIEEELAARGKVLDEREAAVKNAEEAQAIAAQELADREAAVKKAEDALPAKGGK